MSAPLVCSECGEEIPPGRSYTAVFVDPRANGEHAGLRIVGGCEHHPVPEIETAAAVLGSGGCLLDWLTLTLGMSS